MGAMRKFIKENNISRGLFDEKVLCKRTNSKRMNYTTFK